MADLACPSCGAPVPVRSAALPYVTCGYCHTLIRREGEALTAIGKAAVLPFDVSPLQLGTGGSFAGVRFTVVGRVRWGWADGSWNEWLLECSDGTPRWLGEAMGSFMLTREQPDLLDQPVLRAFADGGAIALGAIVDVGGTPYAASDIKEAQCLGSEGDLSRPTPAGATQWSVDFRAPSGGALSVQRDSDGASAWLGSHVELADLGPTNLRALDGWSIPVLAA
jgi:Domain of unknown function (DUF4178)